MGVEGLSSVFIFPILILPRYSVASASTVGVIALQGPHQGAQKSTRTGTSEFSTSWSKEPSVKFSVLSPAMIFVPLLKSVLMMLEVTREMQLRRTASGTGRQRFPTK